MRTASASFHSKRQTQFPALFLMKPSARVQWAVFSAVLASLGLLLIPFCGMAFGCGCTWLWDGAAAHCNIFRAGPPDCPWCAHGTAAGTVATLGIGACQVLLALLTLKRTGRAALACVVGVSTLLPAGLFFAWLTRLLGL